ncbi:MAG: Abi family protein [Clostridia bacterium]
MPNVLKPARTFAEQIALMESRGMLIDDMDKATQSLQRLNYYRISGYAYLFRGTDGRYEADTHFEAIIKIMAFDQALRKVLMGALEPIEIYARTQIAYWFSHNHARDGGAYYDVQYFKHRDHHAQFMSNLSKQIARNRHQPFVKHHIQAYDRQMPLWCAVELLSFSTLSKMYSNMLNDDRESIARSMNCDSKHLENWLHCFSVLRNGCAHYARLYGAKLNPPASLDPKTWTTYKEISQRSLFAYVVAMLRLLPEDSWRERLQNQLVDVVHEYESFISLEQIGFPPNWDTLLFDKKLISLTPLGKTEKPCDGGDSGSALLAQTASLAPEVDAATTAARDS